MTIADLKELEERLAKGWVIRRDQIQSLIDLARQQVELAVGRQGREPQPFPEPWCDEPTVTATTRQFP